MERVFNDPRSTLTWAKKHIAHFERESRDYFNSGAYVEVTEVNPEGTEKTHKIRVVKPIPPELRHRTADIISNLRKSLDQLASAVAVAAGRNGKKDAYFPFGDTIGEANCRRKDSSRNIPDSVFDVMLAFKPYKGGNDALWTMNKLANFDKHQALLPVIGSLGKLTFNFCGAWRTPPRWPYWDSANNEVILAISKVGPHFQMDYQITKHIVIQQVSGAEGQEAVGFFNNLVDMLEEIFSAVEAESRRIGIL